MRFPLLFKRFVGSIPAGAIQLGADADPTSTAVGAASQALLSQDNILKFSHTDSLTNPVSRIVISLNAPSTLGTACTLTAFIYDERLQMWISLAGAQFGRQGSSVTLNHRQIAWFNTPVLCDRPTVADTNVTKVVAGAQGQLSPSLATYIMINSNSPNGASSGEYDFLVGADLVSSP